MKRTFAVFTIFAALALVAPAQTVTHSSASMMEVVNPNAAVLATVTLTSNHNPATIGQLITYSGTVTGSNNGATPTGTVTVNLITGTQTVALGTGGAFTCSETVTAPTSSKGTNVTATYNGDTNFN